MTTEVNAHTKLELVIGQWGQRNRSPFTPTPDFYREVGMSHIRFGKLRRGTAIITGPEASALAHFFRVSLTDLI